MAHSETYAPQASSHESHARHYSGEQLFIWIAIILALAFWLPYTFIVDSVILGGLF